MVENIGNIIGLLVVLGGFYGVVRFTRDRARKAAQKRLDTVPRGGVSAPEPAPKTPKKS